MKRAELVECIIRSNRSLEREEAEKLARLVPCEDDVDTKCSDIFLFGLLSESLNDFEN